MIVPTSPSDAEKARELLDAAMQVHPVPPEQAIAAAAVYARLAALPTPDGVLADYDQIDALLTAAGVPDLIDEPLSARVGWVLERWRGEPTDTETDDGRY